MRTCYLLSVGGLGVGMVLILLGAVFGDFRLLAGGIVALTVAGGAREWLQSRGRFESAEDALHGFLGGEPLSPEAVELMRLARECQALERLRGTRRFDPWAVQALRHDMRELVAKDPSLERFLRT